MNSMNDSEIFSSSYIRCVSVGMSKNRKKLTVIESTSSLHLTTNCRFYQLSFIVSPFARSIRCLWPVGRQPHRVITREVAVRPRGILPDAIPQPADSVRQAAAAVTLATDCLVPG